MAVNGALQAIGAIATVLFVLVAFTPLAVGIGEASTARARIEPADAIVVLGSGIYPEGRLSPPSLQRAIRGITLLRMGLAPSIVFLGSSRARDGRSEAELRTGLALDLGVEPDEILTLAAGLNTRDEADVVRQQLAPLGVERILLVSEGLHLVRAGAVFEASGFEVLPAPADSYATRPEGPLGRLLLMQRILEERLARIYYRAAGYL